MPSIFTTDRKVKTSGEMASSEYALIQFGSAEVALGQQVQGQYGRKIQTIFEIGKPNIYWLAGHEEGQVTVQRLVGTGGFFASIGDGKCGVIGDVTITPASGGSCTGGGGGSLKCKDAILESVSFSMQAGTLEITEGMTAKFATLEN